jgi:hypothetical protein
MVIVCNPQLPTFQQVVLGYKRVVAGVYRTQGGSEYVADLCALTNQCLCHLNNIWNSRVPGYVIRIVLYARWDW